MVRIYSFTADFNLHVMSFADLESEVVAGTFHHPSLHVRHACLLLESVSRDCHEVQERNASQVGWVECVVVQ